MLINQTLDKFDAHGLFGMALGLREQLESSQYTSLSFDERLGNAAEAIFLLYKRRTQPRPARARGTPTTAGAGRSSGSHEVPPRRAHDEADRQGRDRPAGSPALSGFGQ
jgi:hypothetical protein